MDYSNFIILLASQRSGTNALRSVLETHPDIYCHNEVFSVNDIDSPEPNVRQANFFNFMRQYAQGDVTRLYPQAHEKLFLDFLEFLRCFSTKRYMLIDVKYNSTHFLTEPYKWQTAPYLFFLIRKYGLRVFNLTRKNYLRYLVSCVKAQQSGIWSLASTDRKYKDRQVRLETGLLLRDLNFCWEQNDAIERAFSDRTTYMTEDYSAAFGDKSGGVSEELLKQFSSWLGVPCSFSNKSSYRKQSSVPLEETIENYDEVAEILRGTKFEYCLNDELLYAN